MPTLDSAPESRAIAHQTPSLAMPAKPTSPLFFFCAALLLGSLVCTLSQCGGESKGKDQQAPTAGGASADPTANGAAQGGNATTTPALEPAERDPAKAMTDARQLPAESDRVRIAISGELSGRLEPCGCASGQLGGLARRTFYLAQRQFDVLIEGGGLVDTSTELDFAKAYTALEIMNAYDVRYTAQGLSAADLALASTGILSLMQGMNVPAVASDLDPSALDEMSRETWPATLHRETTTKEGITVRIASLVSNLPKPMPTDLEGLKLRTPQKAWTLAMEGVAPESLRVLLVHGGMKAARDAASMEPRPDLIVECSETFNEPPGTPAWANEVPIVSTGVRGRMLVDCSIARIEGKPHIAYDIAALRGSTVKGAQEDAGTREVLLAHRRQVAEQDILEEMLGQADTKNGASYTGSKACGSCHAADLEIWKRSKHGHAWETLEKAEKDPTRYGWPVTEYPDCVSCHVVGFGERTGFLSKEKTPELAGVGCERCHGPGSEHAKTNGKVQLGTVAKTLCRDCHDFEQSPDFDWLERWAIIRHGGK